MPSPRDLDVRPPRQGRTKLAWERILDAGVRILEETGYEGFTIAAICASAGVSPPTIYARVTTKKALFFAVFEHGFRPIRQRLADALAASLTSAGSHSDVIRGVVATIAWATLEHEAFLRVIVRRAEADPEVAERTREARLVAAAQFRAAVLSHPEALRDPSGADVGICFRVLFAALMSRVATPTALDLGMPLADDLFVSGLQDVAVRFLLAE